MPHRLALVAVRPVIVMTSVVGLGWVTSMIPPLAQDTPCFEGTALASPGATTNSTGGRTSCAWADRASPKITKPAMSILIRMGMTLLAPQAERLNDSKSPSHRHGKTSLKRLQRLEE